MNAKHTPGPWAVAPDPEYPEEAFSVYTDQPGHINAEIAGRICDAANARLIAAAPALYAALERAESNLRDFADPDGEYRPTEAALLSLARDIATALATADKGAP